MSTSFHTNKSIDSTTTLATITSQVEKIETTRLEGGDHHILMSELSIIQTTIIGFMSISTNSESKINNTVLLKLMIRVRVCKCQLLGKNAEWIEIIETADQVILHLNELIDYEYRSNVEARVSGYRGFAFMKLDRLEEAIIELSKSYELSKSKRKGVALIDQQIGQDKKQKFNRQEKREIIQVERALLACCQMKGIDAPNPPLTKFSRTVHLFDAGGTAVTTDDLVMPSDDVIYNQIADETTTLYIEEKVDGANFGLSLSGNGQIFAQNRSHYVSSGDHAQFSPLASWIEENRAALTTILTHEQGKRTTSQGLVLYGEWVVARHSIPYHKLPAHFIAFDIYDRKLQRFWSRSRFHTIMKGSGIPVVPIIKEGILDCFHDYTSKGNSPTSFKKELVRLLETKSKFRTDGGPVEGIILRIDDNREDEYGHTWLKSRVKIVRPDFVGGCSEGHWSRREIEKQTVDFDFAQVYLDECYKFATEK